MAGSRAERRRLGSQEPEAVRGPHCAKRQSLGPHSDAQQHQQVDSHRQPVGHLGRDEIRPGDDGPLHRAHTRQQGARSAVQPRADPSAAAAGPVRCYFFFFWDARPCVVLTCASTNCVWVKMLMSTAA